MHVYRRAILRHMPTALSLVGFICMLNIVWGMIRVGETTSTDTITAHQIFNILIVQTLLFMISLKTYTDEVDHGVTLFLISNQADLFHYTFFNIFTYIIAFALPLSLASSLFLGINTAFFNHALHLFFTSCLTLLLTQLLSLIFAHQRVYKFFSFLMLIPLVIPSIFLNLMHSASHDVIDLTDCEHFFIHLGLLLMISTMLLWVMPRLLRSIYQDAHHEQCL